MRDRTHRGWLATRGTLLLAGAAAVLVLAAGCASKASTTTPDGSATPPAPAASAAATLTNADGWPRVEGLRGKRYCEVLLARVIDGRLNADVWNTFGLNDCPDADWKTLDAAAIKNDRVVLAALLNGPRYWLMDAIEKKPGGSRQETMFGSLAMFLAASVDLGPVPPDLGPYIERHVARETVFEYAAGVRIYELVSADGRVFVMQSYSQQNSASLTEADLAGLATRIQPPAGWTYRTRTLDSALRLRTSGADAVVLQDDLSNTYQLAESD